jgi:hypothetical protein
LQANSVAEPSCTDNVQIDQEHSVKPLVEANVVAPEQSGDSTQKLPEQSPKNASMEPVIKETSTATPSIGHSLSSSVRSNVDASEISCNSTQKLPGQSPKNAKMATATSETSIATPSAAPPPSASREANVSCGGIQLIQILASQQHNLALSLQFLPNRERVVGWYQVAMPRYVVPAPLKPLLFPKSMAGLC